MSSPARTAGSLALLAGLAACAGAGGSASSPAPPFDPADAGIAAAAEAAAWGYRRHLEADLDGDGAADRLVLAANVETGADGQPLWEDGHRWAAYVEGAGRVTLLYAGFVPNGFVEAATLRAAAGEPLDILLLERTPSRVRSFRLRYTGPGRSEVVSAADHEVADWLPGSARLP